jgi:Xaa-Pro aminopeptidase
LDPFSTRPDWAGRLDRVQSSLAGRNVDALVVSNGINISYLTGFEGTAGLFVLTPSDRTLIVDGRYEVVAREGVAAGTVAPVQVERVERRYDAALGAYLQSRRARQVGFEAAHTTVATLAGWQRATPGVAWTSTEQVVESLRLTKDAVEIEILRRAGRAIAGVARRLGEIVQRGRSEREVARAIDAALDAAGFSRPAFPTIVASGPNSAHPHAHPSDRALNVGDLVVLDFGGVLDGYCVDLTRMAAVGSIDHSRQVLYDAVRGAAAAALASVRPDIETTDIDAAARGVLQSAGYGDGFVHSTGHGLGLEVHEAPRVGRADPDSPAETVRAGMVFTIEPGAYIAGLGGVRLEDDVLVTGEGCEVLTDAPHDLVIV